MTDFFDKLEGELLERVRTDNRRRRRRRVVVRSGALATVVAVAVGASQLTAQRSTGGPLAAIAQAAETRGPQWTMARTWNYYLNTTIDRVGSFSDTSYVLEDIRRSGDRVVTRSREVSQQPTSKSIDSIVARWRALDRDGAPLRTSESDSAVARAPEPRTVQEIERELKANNSELSCGEAAMSDAVDGLSIPGVAPKLRRDLIEMLASCPKVGVAEGARDPLGRKGTAITLVDDGHGLKTEERLVLSSATAEPLSYSERILEGSEGGMNVPVGTISSASVYFWGPRAPE